MTVAPSGGSADMTVTFDETSTNSTYLLRVVQGGKLVYKETASCFSTTHRPRP
jgi:hypothetical protein